MNVTAFMCVYNEADIIRWTIGHLVEQGVGVHVIDNWSTDGSDEIARGFPLVGFEKFPREGPSPYYSWAPLLTRVSALAAASPCAWAIHQDADEIRRSPRTGESLLDAFARVHKSSYNAVNFQVYHFLPTDDNYTGDPESHFQHFMTDHPDAKMRQVKAWRNQGQRVDLASTGGHFANFPGVLVHPEKLILKHYPIRTNVQAERKVIHERLGRYDPQELAKKWHVQYQGQEHRTNWIYDPKTLKEWENPGVSHPVNPVSSRF